MVKELEHAVKVASSLSADEQKRLAAILLEEIADEQRWDASFAASQSVLEALADEALMEHRGGKTKPMELEWTPKPSLNLP
jgi:hypothetical protein